MMVGTLTIKILDTNANGETFARDVQPSEESEVVKQLALVQNCWEFSEEEEDEILRRY